MKKPCGSRVYVPMRTPSFEQYRCMTDSFQFNEAALPWNSEQKFASPVCMPIPEPDTPASAENHGPVREMSGLMAHLKSLKGLGPRGEELLTKVLAKPLTPPRVIDLLWHLPAGYLDRRPTGSIGDAVPGSIATLLITPVRHNAPPKAPARAPMRVVCEDESGSLDIVFFHTDRGAVRRLLPLHEPRFVSGRIEKYGSRAQMAHPDHIVAPFERAR